MTASNEIIQITIVGIIVLTALVWLIVKVVRMGKNSGGCQCGSCNQTEDCKARELMKHSKQKAPGCRDGQSARN